MQPEFEAAESEGIFEQTVYGNAKGVTIIGRRLIVGWGPRNERAYAPETFHATGVLPLNINGQQANAQFNFDIPGESLDEAYKNFPAAMEAATKKAIADIQAQARQQQILSATADPAAGQMLRRMNGGR